MKFITIVLFLILFMSCDGEFVTNHNDQNSSLSGIYSGIYFINTSHFSISADLVQTKDEISGTVYSFGSEAGTFEGIIKNDSLHFNGIIIDTTFSGVLHINNDTLKGDVVYPITGAYWTLFMIKTNIVENFNYGEYTLSKIVSDSGIILNMANHPNNRAYITFRETGTLGRSFFEKIGNVTTTYISNSNFQFRNGTLYLPGGFLPAVYPLLYKEQNDTLIIMNYGRTFIEDLYVLMEETYTPYFEVYIKEN